MNNSRKTKNKYIVRRVVAIAISFVLIFGASKGIKSLIGRSKKNTVDVVYASEFDQLLKETEPNILEDPRDRAMGQGEIPQDLLRFRQLRLKDNTMGRGAPQSLLNKEVYLTFDDGPSTSTPEVLDILDEYGVKATFFVIGRNAEAYPEILKDTYDRGHEIALHSYTHDYQEIYANEEALKKDIEATLESVRGIVGSDYSTNVYRFPGGSFKRDNFFPMLEEMGVVYFDWNVLNGDAEGSNPSVEYLKDRYNETSRGYNQQIILMHDTAAKTNTVNMLPWLIEDLQSKDFKFKTLGDI